MRLYYITDRRRCPLDLLDCIEANARAGVEWIQIREKDLAVRDVLELARSALARVRPHGTKVLVNGRLDVALAAKAHGVHLPADALPVASLRPVVPPEFLVFVSTHVPAEVRRAETEGADLAVFGPVYPTRSKPGPGKIPGLFGLREACRGVRMPVAALGGVTADRAPECLAAGASVIAGIGMFQSAGALGNAIAAARPQVDPGLSPS